MHAQSFHKVQVAILRALHYAESARFSDLRRPTDLESDSFKFHLRNLVHIGYVQKRIDGRYELTAKGKELSNNLDETKRTVERQPKLSVLIVATRKSPKGETQFLLQRRTRHPFIGFWCEITGRVRWGEAFEDTAVCYYGDLKKEPACVQVWPSGEIRQGVRYTSKYPQHWASIHLFVAPSLEAAVIRPENFERNFFHKIS